MSKAVELTLCEGPRKTRIHGKIDRLSRIANTRTFVGTAHKNSTLFYDRCGNPISNMDVMREVDEGWRYFWSKRGGAPVLPKTSALSRPSYGVANTQ
jgi:hypothetical protein